MKFIASLFNLEGIMQEETLGMARGIEEHLIKGVKRYPAHFYSRLVPNPVKTQALKDEAIKKGENPDDVAEVYEERDYVRIPQGKDVFDGAVNKEHQSIYFKEWQNYKAGTEQLQGTPLEQCGIIPNDIKMKLQLLNIFSVEQFIQMPQMVLNSVAPDMSRFVAEAKRFLTSQYATNRIEEEQKKEARIVELQEKLERLIEAQEKGKKK